jgi:hypothetical protein
MATSDSAERSALTQLTRLARREPQAEEWIRARLKSRMPSIIQPAIEVAAETGEPMPTLLAEAIRAHGSAEVIEQVARSVPIDLQALQAVAIASLESLLADLAWPPGDATDRDVRRFALRVAIALRLAHTGQLRRARAVAEEALADAAVLPQNASVRARSVDALDTIVEAQRAACEDQGAVDTAQRALRMRLSLTVDPFRLAAVGQKRLGEAQIAAGALNAGAETLADAVVDLRRRVTEFRGLKLEIEDQLSEGATSVRVPVTVGYLPEGFDDLIVEAWCSDSLVGQMMACLTLLVRALESGADAWRQPSARVVRELEAGRRALRGLGSTPELRLTIIKFEFSILKLLQRWPPVDTAPESDTVADLERIADEADGFGHPELAIEVRAVLIQRLRDAQPIDARTLVNTLQAQSRGFECVGRPDDAVAAMRDAVAVSDGCRAAEVAPSAGADRLEASALHALARRLAAAGQFDEGFKMSSKAVTIAADELLRGDKFTPEAFTAMLFSLARRARESGSEIELSDDLVEAADLVLDRIGREQGADLGMAVQAVIGLLEAPVRQRKQIVIARRLYAALQILSARRPDDRQARAALVLIGSDMLRWEYETGEKARARAVFYAMAATRLRPEDGDLRIEYAKCAADLANAYGQNGEHGEAAAVVRMARSALLSPAYLAVRERDIGDVPEFAAAIKQIDEGGGEPRPRGLRERIGNRLGLRS